MRRAVLSIALFVCSSFGLPAAESRDAAVDQWRALRVGLFIHWGPSSGLGLAESHSHARLSPLNPHGVLPATDYDQLYKKFNPTAYEPDAWLQLAHAAGMRYAVFVAKHHDGFAMFDSATSDYDVMATPYGRDVTKLFADACRRQGLALGFQISPKDWKHPDFATAHHDRYNAYYEAIIRELASQYGPLAVMWFDGIEGVTTEQWKDTPARIAALLHEKHPHIMLGTHGGAKEDFTSFEIMVGPFDRRNPWETCEAINPSGWVYNKPMPPFPLKKLLTNLVYTVGRDGNYLLDVGPMPDGRLYPPDAERLGEIAAWMKTNAAGIHGTRGGPYRDGSWGAATCRGNNVFLFLSDAVGPTLTLPKLAAEIRSARRLDGGPLEWKTDASALRLSLGDRSAAASRPLFTAVQLELDRPAFALPVLDAQPNLAAHARVIASSIRDGNPGTFGPQHLFDADGDTAWESAAAETTSTLELDLGETKSIAGLAFAERAQRVGWNHGFKVEIKSRATPDAKWQSLKKHNGMLGAPPTLALPVTASRYLRIEIAKKSGVALQVAELRLFGPLP